PPTKINFLLEKVSNPAGSTAGAGSDFFHIYRKHRQTELERLKLMEVEDKEDLEQSEFQQRRHELMVLDDAATGKRRAKRQRRKNAKRLALEATKLIKKQKTEPPLIKTPDTTEVLQTSEPGEASAADLNV
ncbi:MAG: hypothetical protein KVP17_000821, partial [Porospora cf. gigantea B]|uniref:uncharacterized protein n=2 Tax=Porospora cf. gigantea B TaxID=2853592 RepID=UPI003571A8B5